MGVLHKLVHILGKLDPDNDKWKQRQLARLDSPAMRDELEKAFESNDDDYGRKLYLIENCIYGVDIQPIAIQISKLRFFISLVCDQQTNDDPADNRGVLPLPNLETRFVAADTLIGLKKSEQRALFDDPDIERLERDLQDVRHQYFAVRTRKDKLKLQARDRKLRQRLAQALEDSTSMDSETSRRLAGWDPYDPQQSADFFEPLWMFDQSLGPGFNIILGNPPYGARISDYTKSLIDSYFQHQSYQNDSYLLFLERGFQLLAEAGVQSLIIPNTLLPSLKFTSIRRFIFGETRLISLVDIKTQVFKAVVDNIILTHSNVSPNSNKFPVVRYEESSFEQLYRQEQAQWHSDRGDTVSIALSPKLRRIASLINDNPLLEESYSITPGCKPYQKGKGKPRQTADIVKEQPYTSDQKISNEFRALLRGKLIQRYRILWNQDLWIKFGEWLAEPRSSAQYDAERKIVIRQTGDSLIAALDTKKFVVMNNVFTIVPIANGGDIYFVLSAINSSVLNWHYRVFINPERGEALAEVKKGHLTQLPIPVISSQQQTLFRDLVKLIAVAYTENHTSHSAVGSFLTDLIDACVMETFFASHMAERDLLFHDEVAGHLEEFDPNACESDQEEYLQDFYRTLNASNSDIRNRLLRISADSPDLLAIIKEEGQV